MTIFLHAIGIHYMYFKGRVKMNLVRLPVVYYLYRLQA